MIVKILIIDTIEIGIMVQKSNVRLWSRKMRPQDLKSQIVTSKMEVIDYIYIHTRHEPLKND